jgi:hypothetical protein
LQSDNISLTCTDIPHVSKETNNMFYIAGLYSSCEIVSMRSLVHVPFAIVLLLLGQRGDKQDDLPVYCPYIVL